MQTTTDTGTPAHIYSLCRYCSKFFYEDENSNTSCSYHPKLPVDSGHTGPRGDYADVWRFPCCQQGVVAGIFQGSDRAVDQSPGCVVTAHVVESGWNVFMSYSRSDEGSARVIERELLHRGHRVWRDRTNIAPGAEWQKTIDIAIRDADHMIVLLSPDSVASVQVQREIALAQTNGINLVPILIASCVLPKSLAALNCLDWRDSDVFNKMSEFHELRQAVVFGGAIGLWIQSDSHRLPSPSVYRQRAEEEQVLVVHERGATIGTVHAPRPYAWQVGHLLSVDDVVYAVTDVIAHTATSVEVTVERAKLGGT